MNRISGILILLAAVAIALVVWFAFSQNDTRNNDNNSNTTEQDKAQRSNASGEKDREVAIAKTGEGSNRTKAAGPEAVDSKKGQIDGSATSAGNAISGRVVTSESRQAIAGARIWLESSGDLFRYFSMRKTELPAPTATTDSKGEFTIPSIAASRDYVIRIEAPGRIRHQADVPQLSSKEKRQLGELPLAQGCALEGKVTDSAGGPIAGATVLARRAAAPGSVEVVSFRAPLDLEATTDSTGHYLMDGFTPNQPVSLSAVAKSYIPNSTDTIEPKVGTPRIVADLILREGKEITGRVLDRAGAPVTAAMIQTWRSGAGDFFLDTRLSEAIQTDANGNFMIRGLDERNVSINVVASGKGSTTKRNVVPGTRDLVIQLEDLGVIRGKITVTGVNDSATLAALFEHTQVEANRSAGMMMSAMVIRDDADGTDSHVKPNGEFEIGGLEKGKYRVHVTGDSLAPALSQEVDVAADRPVENLQIQTQQGAVLIVKVAKHGTGEPVVGAKVRLVEKREGEDPMFNMFGNGDDDEDGGGPVMTPMRGSVGGAIGAVKAVRAVRSTSSSASSGGAVRGGPMRGGRAGKMRIPGGDEDGKPDAVRQTVKSDENGIAKFTGLPFSNFEVSAKADDLAPSGPKELDLKAAPVAQPSETQLSLSEGGALTGKVLRPDGSPAMGSNIQIVGPDPEMKTQRSAVDETGKYTIEHLRVGAYHVSLLKKDDGTGGFGNINFRVGGNDTQGTPVAIEDGKTTTLHLNAPALALISGVVSQAGVPVHGAKVTLASADGAGPEFDNPMFEMPGTRSATTDANGKYKFADVESGKYKLSARKTGAIRGASREVEVVNEKETVDITVPRGVIEGRVVRADGHEPVANATVQLVDDAPDGKQQNRVMVAMTLDGSGGDVKTFDGRTSVRTDAKGNFKLEDLPVGKFRVKAMAAGLRDGRSDVVEMGADQKISDVEVALEKAASVVGRVTGPGGAGRQSVLVSLRKADDPGPGKVAVTDAEGRYKFTSLDPGDYKISSKAMGGSFTFGGDDAKAVPITLEAGVETTKDMTVDQ